MEAQRLAELVWPDLDGDAATYEQARVAFTSAIARFPRDIDARSALASLSGTLHQFDRSLDLADGLLAEHPDLPTALATRGDALLELGRYDEARAIYVRLRALAPQSPAAVARVARVEYLYGDIAGARRDQTEAEDLARKSALTGPGLAWYTVARSTLAWEVGDYQAAATLASQAAKEAPDYYLPRFALARARASQGRTREAIAMYAKLIESLPQPEYVVALGDLYASIGDTARANAQYATAS